LTQFSVKIYALGCIKGFKGVAVKKNLTRKDIAEAAGVSPSTVSRALAGSELLPRSTIERISEIARDMGYHPNVLAKRLATNRSFQIGFAVPSVLPGKGTFRTMYFSNILDAVVKEAFSRGYGVSIYPYELENDSFITLKTGKHVDGFVFAGLKKDSGLPLALASENIPFVIIGSQYKELNVPSVNCEPLPGITEMLEALAERHVKRLFFVHGDMDYYDASEQKKALLKVTKSSAVKLAGVLNGNYSRSSGYEAAAALSTKLKTGDCVFLANDRMAMGFYRYCYEHGIQIPLDVSVIGSDNDDNAYGLFPELSTIEQPRTQMGQAAVSMLIDILEKKKVKTENIKIPEKFLIKKSI